MKKLLHFSLLGMLSGLTAMPVLAQKDKILEIARDVAQLNETVRQIQRTQDEKMTALLVLVQQALDAANKANTTAAVTDSNVRDRLANLDKSILAPVAGVGGKVDQMNSDFNQLRESVIEMSAQMKRLDQKLEDVKVKVSMIGAQPAPPPPTVPQAELKESPTRETPKVAAVAPPPGLSAEQLFNQAMRDRVAGNSELAINQFQDYLKYFGQTDLAPNSQFYIGEIQYLKGDYAKALESLNTFFEAYPANATTADALFLKGICLEKSGQKLEARKEFETLIEKYPSSEYAAKAKTRLKVMTPAATAPARKPTASTTTRRKRR